MTPLHAAVSRSVAGALLVLSLLVPLGPVQGAPGPVDPAGSPGTLAQDVEVRTAALRQQALPALTARTQAATARLLALEQVQDGTGSLTQALPELDEASLGEVEVLKGRVRALDDRAVERAAARGSSRLAEDLDPALVAEVQQATAQAEQAEQAADEAERRVLLQMVAWLGPRPWARTAGLQALLAPYASRIEAAREATGDAAVDASVDAAAAAVDRAAIGAWVAQLRRAALAGSAVPDLAPLRDRLASGTSGEVVALQLAMVLPDLAEPERIAVASELTRALTALPVETSQPLEALKAQRAVVPDALAPLLDARIAAAEQASATSEAAVQSSADASETRREAEAARSTDDASAELTSRLIEARLPAQQRVTTLQERLAAETDQVAQEQASALGTVDAARKVYAELVRPTPGTPRPEVDAIYRALRALLSELRTQARKHDAELARLQRSAAAGREVIQAELMRLAEARAAVSGVQGTKVGTQRKEALDHWAQVLQDESDLHARRIQQVQDARDASLALLTDAATLRRDLSAWVSRSERAADRGGLVPELLGELSMIGPTWFATLRSRIVDLQDDPWWFLNLNHLTGLLTGSLWLFLALGTWVLARRYMSVPVAMLIRRLARARDLAPHEMVDLRSPLHTALVTATDVAAAWVLTGLVPKNLPELFVVLLLVFEVQLVRLELAIFELLVDRSGGVRPALLHLPPEAWMLARRTVLALATWVAVQRVLLAFAHDVLAGFATEQLERMLSWWALLVLAVVLAYAWAPHMRGLVNARTRKTRMTRLLVEPPPTVLLAGPQAIGGAVFLLFMGLRDLFFGVARQEFMGRWFAAVDRLRFGRSPAEDAEAAPPTLDEEQRAKLLSHASARAFQDRPKARAALNKAIMAWHDDELQGLIALLGDTGEGRTAALDHWREDWQALQVEVIDVQLDRRLTTADDALTWLAHTFDLPAVPSDVDGAVAAMDARLGPAIYTITGLHLAFLRTVGGFEALRTLLDVLHADGLRRCYVLVFYRPSWRYLERLGNTMNVHLVRAAIDLSPLEPKALRQLTEGLVAEQDQTLDFEGLAARGAFAGDLEVERERAIEAYYRLLASASAGNPAVALQLWSGCLTPSPGGRLRVRVTDALRSGTLPALSDDHLFVLAAVRTQGELTEDELADVLNMGMAQVRALVREMVGGSLLLRGEHGVHVALRQLPSVTQLLKRRHFIHWS